MNVTNSSMGSFNVNKIDVLFSEASKPNTSSIKLNDIVQDLMKNLNSGDILVVKEVLDPKNVPTWKHIYENMEKLVPGAIPQFNALINNIHTIGNEYQKIFKSSEPQDLQKVWVLTTHAIDNQDLERLDVFINLGLSLNSSFGAWTPLSYAVMKEKFSIIEYAFKKGANINFFDTNGYSPLKYAVLKDRIELAACLMQNGADPNLIDKEGLTPLKYAISEDKPNMVACLLKHGADPNLFIALDDVTPEKAVLLQEPPLAYAISLELPHIVSILNTAGADNDYTQDYLQQTFLASIWGIEGSIELVDKTGNKHRVEVEGTSRRKETMKNLSRYADAFFSSKKHGKQIIEALNNSHPPQPFDIVLNTIKKGEPITLLGGALDHAVGFVIFEDKLCLCNRGYGGGDDAIEVFEISPEVHHNIQFLEALSEIYDTTEMLLEVFKKYKLKKIGGYRQKDQTSGNCTWASAKTCVGALCRLLLGEDEGKKEYKNFSGFCREASLNEYIYVSKSPNQDLFDKITSKVANKKDQHLVESTLAITLKGKKTKKRKKH